MAGVKCAMLQLPATYATKGSHPRSQKWKKGEKEVLRRSIKDLIMDNFDESIEMFYKTHFSMLLEHNLHSFNILALWNSIMPTTIRIPSMLIKDNWRSNACHGDRNDYEIHFSDLAWSTAI